MNELYACERCGTEWPSNNPPNEVDTCRKDGATFERVPENIQALGGTILQLTPVPIRVVRMLEYTYGSVERMTKDMRQWQIGANATRRYGSSNNSGMTIKSAIMLPEIVEEDTNGK